MTASLLVIFTVASVLWLSRQKNPILQKVLDWFPAILFAYVIPAAFTHIFGWDLSTVVLHRYSKEWIIPLAILSVMSALSFKQLRIIGLRPILLFVAGSFIIAVLPALLLWASLAFNNEMYSLLIVQGYWKGLVPIVGSWIGGSTSQLVLKEIVECPESLFLTILVLDNVLVNLWTILMFQLIKRSDKLNNYFGIKDQVPDFVPDKIMAGQKDRKSILLTLAVLALVLFACTLSTPSFIWKIVILSLAGLALGNFLPFWNHGLVLKIGGVLIVLIMAILGLKLNFDGFELPGLVIAFVAVWLVLHYLFMMLIARLLKLHMAWVPISSMANLGGISTAPAVTAAYNEEWMPHAILLAILSMVSGTAWGTLTIFLFHLF